MFVMGKSKSLLVGGSIVGTFILVFGTAILFRLLMGTYFMKGGLADSNYILLALLCAVPFAVCSLIEMNKNPKKHIEAILIGGVLFSLIFMTVHGCLVFSASPMTDAAITRTLIVFPISALFIVLAAYFSMSMGRPYRES